MKNKKYIFKFFPHGLNLKPTMTSDLGGGRGEEFLIALMTDASKIAFPDFFQIFQ